MRHGGRLAPYQTDRNADLLSGRFGEDLEPERKEELRQSNLPDGEELKLKQHTGLALDCLALPCLALSCPHVSMCASAGFVKRSRRPLLFDT